MNDTPHIEDGELSEDDVKSLVDALLMECAAPVNDAPPPPLATFERRPSWMSQVGSKRTKP